MGGNMNILLFLIKAYHILWILSMRGLHIVAFGGFSASVDVAMLKLCFQGMFNRCRGKQTPHEIYKPVHVCFFRLGV